MVVRTRRPSRFYTLSSLAALATGLAAGAAHAQSAPSYNAPAATVTSGTVNQVRGSGTDTFNIGSATAVLDFQANAATVGGVVNFQNAGSTATYNGTSNFTVLNRIVPADSSLPPVSFSGHVVSQITDPVFGTVTRGGTVWFYSPGGIVLTGTSRFDVGNLLLTTRDPINGAPSFTPTTTFTGGGTGNASVVIQSGAIINASNALNNQSYVALVAPIINQSGTVNVNGAAAYVAAEQATLTFSPTGLFSIDVTVGSDGGTVAPGQPLRHLGVTQGPSNAVNTDNHAIYLVSVPKNNAVTMIVAPSGQLGFALASSASVQNGQVILAAGRNVVAGVIDDGTRPSTFAANISIDAGSGGDGHFTSLVNARATDVAKVQPFSGETVRFDQGLTLVGGTQAFIDLQPGGAFQAAGGNVRVQSTGSAGQAFARAGTGTTFTVANDLTVRADTIGLSLSGPATPDPTTGGAATIQANGGTITAGTATVASVISGNGGQTLIGGQAQFGSLNGGLLAIGGAVTADARVTRTGATSGAGANSFGGGVFVRVAQNSTMSIGGAFNVLAGVAGGDGATGGNASGGTTNVTVDSGTLSVTGAFNLTANGIGGAGATGGSASGATALINVTNNRGSITAGNTTVDASEVGGAGTTGAGGAATGGSASVTIDAPLGTGATPQMQLGFLYASAAATGGVSATGAGGSATGGTASVSIAAGTSFTASNNVTETAEAIGGASGGNAAGGDAIGGVASFVDFGTANVPGIILIGRATGGSKAAGTGNGGNASGGRAYINGDNGGQLVATGTVNLDISALGGSVTGGTGQGGRATSLDVSINALGASHLTLHDVSATSNSTAGASRGVATASDGDASGATVYLLQNDDGRLDITTSVDASANGTGGAITAGIGSGTAGTGRGGDVRFVSNDGTITASTNVTLNAKGQGGASDGGARGGNGIGGNTDIGSADVLTMITGNVALDSTGIGGSALSGVGSGGDGSGGSSFVSAVAAGSIQIGGTVQQTANGRGGVAIGAGTSGGVGTGGNAELYALIGGTVTVTGATTISAIGTGGDKTDGTAGFAGNSLGGSARATAYSSTVSLNGLDLEAGAVGARPGNPASEGSAIGGTATLSTVDNGAGASFTNTGSTTIDAGAGRTYPTLFGNNAATNGGTASIVANVGTITLGNTVIVRSDAVALDSGASPTPTAIFGGNSLVQATGGDITLGNNVQITALGNASTVAALGRGVGLPASGGTIDFSAAAGHSLTSGFVTMNASGFGGSIFTANTAPAFGGTGGTITATAAGTITVNGALNLNARGVGGNKLLGATGVSGDGFGGSATVRAAGGTFIVNGNVTIDASAVGGDTSLAGAGLVSDGGFAIGGGARLDTVGTNSLVQISGNVTLKADATGANGRGVGSVGGFGNAGSSPDAGPYTNGAFLVTTIGDISIGGDALVSAVGRGGSGAFAGGTGMGGLANILAVNGTITLTNDPSATATLDASGFGGNATTDGTTFGGGTGGFGIGDRAVLSSATDDNGPSTITIPNIVAVASGTGGAGAAGLSGATGMTGGNGGLGAGGLALIIAQAGNGHLVSHILTATTVGQGGAAGNGGNTNTDPVSGGSAGRGGDGTGGQAMIGLLDGPDSIDANGFFQLDSLTTTVDGRGGTGGDGGTGGPIPFYDLHGVQIGFDHIGGTGGDGGGGTGGSATLVATGTLDPVGVTIGDVTMDAIGQGGTAGIGNGTARIDGTGGGAAGGTNRITVTNRLNRTERGALNIFSVDSDTSGHYGSSTGNVFSTTAGGTQFSVTGGDASISQINIANDGFDFPASGNETSFTVDDGTLTNQQAFIDTIGDIIVTTSATGRFETDDIQLYTNGSLLFADPSNPDALANFVVNDDFYLSIGGNFTTTAPLMFGGNATIFAGDIVTGDITAAGAVSLNGAFSLATGNIVAGDTIDLHTDNNGASSNISAGNLSAAGNRVQVTSVGGNVTVGDVSSGGDIELQATESIQAGSLTSLTNGSIDVSTENGPIVIGDVSGGAIDIFTDDDNGTADSVTTGNLVATNGNVSVASRGNAVTTGNISASDSIFLNATNAINTGTLTTGSSGFGFIGVSTDNGPVVVGDVTGSDISIVSNDENDSAGDVTTGNLIASINSVLVQSAGGTVSTGNVQAGDTITLNATNGITAGALTAGTNGGSVDGLAFLTTETGSITVGDASGGAIAIDGGDDGDVTTGALTARNLEIHSLGALTTGDVSVLASVPSDIDAQPAVALTSTGDLTTGNLTADRLIALASTEGSLRTGILTTTGSIAGFAAQNITLGGATTGTGATDSLFLSNVSILASNPDFDALNLPRASSTFDPAILARTTPVAVAGAISIGGPVVTGILLAAAGTTLTTGDVTTSTSFELTNAGTITTGAIDAADVLLVSTGGSVNTGNIRSGRDLILLASGGITLGSATTGLAAPTYPGSVYLGNASQRSLIAGSNRAPLLAAAPVATGGAIQIAGPVTTGTVKAASGAGLTIQSAMTTSGDVVLDAAGLATIGGAISASSIQLASSDIALTGSLSASSPSTLRLIARGGSAGVRFGGDGTGGGYNLSATEAALLRSPNIVFQADGDVLVGAATLNGSASTTGANLVGSSGKLTITSPGTIRVTGALQLNNMASGNRLTLNAARRVEVATDLGGSITLLSGTTPDALGGTAELIGNTIAIGSSNLLAQLASNPRFAGRNAALAAAARTPRAAGYLQANRIELAGVDTIAIQNSGTAIADGYAGFTAGSGGMEVRTALGGATSVATPMDLAIFGRVQGASGFLTGAQTRTGITFTTTPQTAGFTASSSVNGCLISTGECPPSVPVIPPEVVMIAPNIAAIAPKLIDIFLDAANMPELSVEDGIDLSALAFQPLIDEPVSSGGNPSFWSGAADGGTNGGGEPVTGTGNPDTGNDNRTGDAGNPVTGSGNRTEGAGTPATGTGNGSQGARNPAAGSGSGSQGADTPAPGNGNAGTGSGSPATGTGNGATGQRRPGDGEF